MDNKSSLTTKGRYQLKYRGVECLNCKHPLDMSDKFCPNCSQMNSLKKPSLKDFFDEFFSSLISYDSKLLKTLSTLLIKPGTITRDYMNGKRVSYTNPFRFLLSLGIIYFLMSGMASDFGALDRFAEENTKGTFKQNGPFSFTYSSEENTIAVDSLTPEQRDSARIALLERLEASGNKLVPGDVLNMVDSLQQLEGANEEPIRKDSLILADPIGYFNGLKEDSFFDRFYNKQDFFQTLAKERNIYSFSQLGDSIPIPSTYENKMAFSSGQSIRKLAKQPGSFMQSLISKFPFVIFFFLPVFALFIWLMYVRKKFTYIDHLIFSFHNQSLLFILLIVSFIIDAIFGTVSSPIFLLIFSFYLYKSMRKFYGQGRFKTIVKYLLLNTIFVILASISVTILLTGSALTY